MFKFSPHKNNQNDQSFTTASKRTQTLSLSNKKQMYPSHESDKRPNSGCCSKINQKNKKRILKLQMMPQIDSQQKTAIKWRNKSQSKSSRCVIMRQDKNYQLKIKAIDNNQTINKLTRIILIDWLIEVSLQLKISKEAFYQAVHYLDKLTLQEQINKSDYQFYGLVCLWLSHKTDSRKPISYVTAEQMVKGSRDEKWFKETEVRILKKLEYKLNPFTVWHWVSMLVCGFEKYFKKQIVQMTDWPLYRNRIGWICEGLIMENKYKEKQKELVALSIIFLVGRNLAELCFLQQKKLFTFCLKLSSQQNIQLLYKSTQKIKYWLDYNCDCNLPFSPQIHHAELKHYAKQK